MHAERRYAACDPDNRLIAAQLEKNWEASLRRVGECEARVEAAKAPASVTPSPGFTKLAEDLDTAWSSPKVTMRTRQQLVRALVNDITVDIDEASREIVLTIHWKDGRHSKLRLRKPQSGQHESVTSERCSGRDPEHGWPLVRREHRRHLEPHGAADRTRQDVDGTSGQLDPTRSGDPRLPIGR